MYCICDNVWISPAMTRVDQQGAAETNTEDPRVCLGSWWRCAVCCHYMCYFRFSWCVYSKGDSAQRFRTKAPHSQSTKHVWEGRTGFKNKSQWNKDEMPSSASLFCDQLALIHGLNANTNGGCDCPTSSTVAAAWQTAGGSAVSRGFPQRCQPKVCFIYRCVYCSPSSAGWN